jgi:hypothetical protein
MREICNVNWLVCDRWRRAAGGNWWSVRARHRAIPGIGERGAKDLATADVAFLFSELLCARLARAAVKRST